VVDSVVRIIDDFQYERRADIWSGVGLASAYGGGADRTELYALKAYAEPYRAQLARGAATAAAGRELAGNPTAHTDLACEVYCGLASKEASRVLDQAREDMGEIRAEPAYEAWRRRTEALLTV
jgi:enediyne biosynthesis protein E3